MPIVRIELFPGRSQDKKLELARAITKAFETTLGSSPEDVTVQFCEIAQNDWVVAGKAFSIDPTRSSNEAK
jgi:4-oxalocrotonate tautomerase